jgi:Na+/glutamate symporter
MADNEHKLRAEDTKQASTIIAVVSAIGLTICFSVAVWEKAEIPLFLYAIFGGGILGTDNVLKFIKAIFRVGNGNGK